MEVRTNMATVERLVGGKGVAIVEVTTYQTSQEFKMHATVWLGEGHGLQVGDRARFYGQLRAKTREYQGTWYADVSLSDAQVLPGTLERKPQTEDATAGAWKTATPGEAAAWSEAQQ